MQNDMKINEEKLYVIDLLMIIYILVLDFQLVGQLNLYFTLVYFIYRYIFWSI